MIETIFALVWLVAITISINRMAERKRRGEPGFLATLVALKFEYEAAKAVAIQRALEVEKGGKA